MLKNVGLMIAVITMQSCITSTGTIKAPNPEAAGQFTYSVIKASLKEKHIPELNRVVKILKDVSQAVVSKDNLLSVTHFYLRKELGQDVADLVISSINLYWEDIESYIKSNLNDSANERLIYFKRFIKGFVKLYDESLTDG